MVASVASSVALWPQISRCTYSSRLRHKSRRRGKLLGLPTSMAFEYVGLAWRGWNSPVRRYCGTTSLALVEATKRATGKPMRLAKIHAVRLPKFPLGTETIIDTYATGSWRYAAT